jgi:hypothetical protein
VRGEGRLRARTTFRKRDFSTWDPAGEAIATLGCSYADCTPPPPSEATGGGGAREGTVRGEGRLRARKATFRKRDFSTWDPAGEAIATLGCSYADCTPPPPSEATGGRRARAGAGEAFIRLR